MDQTHHNEQAVLLPASYAQQRVWFLDRLEPEEGVYIVPVANRLRGPLDVDALRAALNEVVARHESLRTFFVLEGDVVQQLIGPHEPLALPVADLRGRSDAEGEALRLRREEARRPFDLERERPLRASLLRLADDDHILLLTLHHIVADAWSIGVLMRELITFYNATREGRALELPELPIQYGDYAVWQQDWIESGGLAPQLAYWRDALAGAAPLLELPTDFPRPAEQSFRGNTVRTQLSRALTERLADLAAAEGATTFMTMLTAWAILLERYTGNADVVVATPVANRNRTELEGVIGLFVNTLAVRVQIDPEASFRDNLALVRDAALGAFSNQDLPFEQLVQELNPKRDRSYEPIAQVLFSTQSDASEPPQFSGVEREVLGGDRDTTKFDLGLYVRENPGGMLLGLEYRTDLFGAETIERMQGHLRTLLEAVVAEPGRRLGTTSILTGAELDELVHGLNQTDAAFPSACVHELIAEQASRTPDAIAVQFGERTLTYRELDGRSNQLARRLRGLGVESGVLVGICVERSEMTIVAIQAVLKAGGGYVPIDPDYPADRQAFMLENSSAPVILTQQELAGSLPRSDATIVCLDTSWEEIAALDDTPLGIAHDQRQLAYVIYTSGSTGQPKAVQIEHRSLVNLMCTMRSKPGLGSEDAIIANTTLSFDMGVPDLYLPLLCGARMVISPAATSSDPFALAALLDQSGATVLQATPTTWQMLIDSGWKPPRSMKALCGGEALPVALAGSLLATGVELWNMYGPTETTVWSTCGPITTIDEPLTVGRPLANTKLYILDQRMQLAPLGVPGELFIGGVGLGRGYRGRDDLTAERFLPDPFASEPDARMYRTGDQVRYRPDGRVEYLGRIDHQIKLRGFRIELGEIETVLAGHPAIGQSVAVLREDEPGDVRLVAYATVADGLAVEPSELIAHLRRSLPDYMIPQRVMLLDSLPLGPTGKLDRKALPVPDGGSHAGTVYAPATTELEAGLVSIWERLLKVEPVGINDDFFDLGGHSLLAIQLVSRIRDELELEAPLRTVFEAPTVALFARALHSDATGGGAGSVGVAIEPVARERRMVGDRELTLAPASFAERRLWFLDRLRPNDSAYNIPIAMRLRGRLDADAMQRALTELVQRHESLRTTFELIEGEPWQVIHPPSEVPLPITDIEAHPDRAAEAQRLVTAEARRPFDLAQGPLFRAGLIRIAAQDHVLLISLHHVVGDAWSLGVINRELSALYGAYLVGAEIELGEPALQYGDYAVWQQEWMRSGGLDAQVDYWREQLAGVSGLLELPTDFKRPPEQSFNGAITGCVLEPELLAQIRALGRSEGATLFMTLLTGFGLLLSRYSGQDDIVVASPVANRDRTELEGLIGFLVNTLALRVDLSESPTFRQLLGRVRETALGAYSHQDLPFEKLIEELQPERHRSHPPLAQVLFALGGGVAPIELPGLERERMPLGRGVSKFDLSLIAVEDAGALRMSFEYCTDLFEPATVDRMLGHLKTLLEAAVASPDLELSALPMLTGSEREALLRDFAQTAEGDFEVACMHELFAEHARRAPGATAVTHDAESITYGELNARANRLARHLRGLGIGRESLVALFLEPSIEMIVSILGVLKAGGAYVPLDPAYPEERIAFSLQDSGAAVVVTTEEVRARLPECNAEFVSLDRDAAALAGYDADELEPLATPECLAYVIYTSGSTGRPKGVLVEHRQVARLFTATDDWYGFGPSDVWALLHSYAFDFSVWELWGALAYGGRLVISPHPTTRSPDALAALVAHERVTVMNATPSLFVAVQDSLLAIADRLALRYVVFGGEALAPASLRPWYAHFGADGPTLVNMYGITETTVHVTYRPLSASDCGEDLSPIGEPIPDLGLFLLDPAGEPVPVGVTGELYVGGGGVARGYLNRPELTAERFIDNPFGAGKLYRTGDLARRLHGGELDFRGRIDNQVKVRGFRIELGEIETVLARHPDVAQAVVILREDEPGDARLAAYATVVEGREADPAELIAHLRRSVPDYMVPSHATILPSFPLSPTGKVDRRRLPAPDSGSHATTTYAPPETELETELVGIWQRLLKVEPIGIDDNFFDLGGHSLLAVQVVQTVEEQLGRICALPILFRTGTIRSLAAELHAGGADCDKPTVLELSAGRGGTPVFCIAGIHVYQELADALALDGPVYGIFLPYEQQMFENELDTGAISMEEMAAGYVRTVREKQPHGPYVLLGLSIGGLVINEMARQLEEVGETVSLLVILDTMVPGSLQHKFKRRMELRKRRIKARLRPLLTAVGLRPAPTASERELAALIRRRTNLYVAARERHRVHAHRGEAVLVRAQATIESAGDSLVDATFGWGAQINNLRVLDAVGNHITHLRRPHVLELAAELRPLIIAARAPETVAR